MTGVQTCALPILLLSKRREPRPRYTDEYAANDYLDDLPWSAIQPQSRPQVLRWASLASSDDEQVPHAAILAFISAPVSTAVGATDGELMKNAAANAAPFTQSFDARTLCGFGNNEDHDHSGEFEYHLSRLKGPRQFWIDVTEKAK